MSYYYNIVPWYNSEEWCSVYMKIYSTSSSPLEKQEALDMMLVWKARCPFLPSGIESTLSLLEVKLQDLSCSGGALNERVLRLAYSTAIMRFVNHMLDTETIKGSSLYQAAKNLDIPDWIIDLRHDTAHSNNLPSIALLREATDIGMQWLQNIYWNKYKESIKDYIVGEKKVTTDHNRIATTFNLCLSLSICSHPKSKIKKLSDIPDENMRDSIINDVQYLFGDTINISDSRTVSIMSLINILYGQSKALLSGDNIVSNMNETLLGEESLFLSLELVNLLEDSTSSLHEKTCLGKNYMLWFEVLLTYLHYNDLLLDFLLELISLSKCEELVSEKRKLAALWVSEILKAVKRSQDFLDKLDRMQSDEKKPRKKKELKLLFHHWFPREKKCGLLLDLQKRAPNELININYVQPIITAYNPYLTYFIRDVLNLLRPQLPKENYEQICTLADLISKPPNCPVSFSKLYTVDDVKTPKGKYLPSLEDSDSDCIEMIVEEHDNYNQVAAGIWHLASKEHTWSKCPIGILPWQLLKPSSDLMECTNEL